MSAADFKKYGQMIAEQEDVRQKAKDIGINNIEQQIAYAKELGLEFTVEDMQAMADEAGLTQGELSDEQLEQVAGGVLTAVAAVAGVVGAVAGVSAIGVQVGSEASTRW